MNIDGYNRAVVLREAGREEDALREFESLAKLESDAMAKGSLLGQQAMCLWRLGRLKDARQRLSEAIMYWPNVYTEHQDACLSRAEGNRKEALHKLTLFLNNHGDLKQSSNRDDRHIYFDALATLGFCSYELGQYAEAVGPLEEALSFFEDNDRRKKLSHFAGRCHSERGNLQMAEDRLLEGLPADPRDPWWLHGQYALGCLYFRRGAYHKAREAFEICEARADEMDSDFKTNIAAWLVKLRSASERIQ